MINSERKKTTGAIRVLGKKKINSHNFHKNKNNLIYGDLACNFILHVQTFIN